MQNLLMCKNNIVYNIDTDKVLNIKLLPGYIKVYTDEKSRFKHWLKLRYSSNTNSLARQLKGITFGQGNRTTINRETHSLSLIDTYWLKKSDENILFEDISPYYNSFWTGYGLYSGQPIPTLYVPGYLDKCWINSSTLYKKGEEALIEAECSRLCKYLGIRVADIQITPDKSGILVSNITSPKYMLEQADQSGLIDPDDFDSQDIIKHFGLEGYQMILLDAIIGNGDRHTGNFGWLRDTDTGDYVCMAPLYDFDHALDATGDKDILIREAVTLAKSNKVFYNTALKLASSTLKLNTHKVFIARASSILSKL